MVIGSNRSIQMEASPSNRNWSIARSAGRMRAVWLARKDWAWSGSDKLRELQARATPHGRQTPPVVVVPVQMSLMFMDSELTR